MAGRNLIAVIGDEDTVTGLLLAGIGHVDTQQRSNFFIVDAKTPAAKVEETFQEYKLRKDIAIILINQHVAETIRPLIEAHNEAYPALLEIPSKDHPYDPSKDSVLKRVQKLFGE
ncbi:ATPase, V1 complex, subunit F [Syncephalis fuscata]|nr:ATPase, V1 complex, subunit F [Syncephalis fuscata]